MSRTNAIKEGFEKEFSDRLYTKLSEWMRRNKANKKDFCVAAGIYPPSLYGYLNGKTRPTYYNLWAMCRVLGCSEEELSGRYSFKPEGVTITIQGCPLCGHIPQYYKVALICKCGLRLFRKTGESVEDFASRWNSLKVSTQ